MSERAKLLGAIAGNRSSQCCRGRLLNSTHHALQHLLRLLQLVAQTLDLLALALRLLTGLVEFVNQMGYCLFVLHSPLALLLFQFLNALIEQGGQILFAGSGRVYCRD